MWLFAVLIHKMKGLAIIALFITATFISLFSGKFRNLYWIIGFTYVKGNLTLFSIVGLLSGLLMSILYNSINNLPLLPLSLTISALIAPLIGITEELIFRGFIQGSITKSTDLSAIIFASFSHSVYKFLIIWSFPVHLNINLYYLTLFTFLAGILLGWLRSRSCSIIPSSLAHGCFDVIVYGNLSTLPIWVWA